MASQAPLAQLLEASLDPRQNKEGKLTISCQSSCTAN